MEQTCAKCGWTWTRRKGHAHRCPKCRKRNPDRRSRVAACAICGKTWETWVKRPLRCGFCGAGRTDKAERPRVRLL